MSATTPVPRQQKSAAFEYLTTRKDEFVGWARKFSLFPYPFVTACCAMEFMSVSSTLYDTDRFGAALPRFTPRQSDLLMVVGTVSHKQAPILRKVYEQMCEPKWVIAFGVCATSGGFYQNYAALPGIDKIIPGRPVHPGLPAAAGDGDRRHHEAAGQDRGRAPPDHQPGFLSVSTGENLLERVQASLGAQALETGMAHGILVLQIAAASLVPVVAPAQAGVRLRPVPGRHGNGLAAAPAALRRRVPLLFHPRFRPRPAQDAGRGSGPDGRHARAAVRLGALHGARMPRNVRHRFRGNDDLRPLLLYEGFVGHPLRKDYPKQREQPLVPYRDVKP